MGYTLVFNTEIAADFKESREWYEAQQNGLGDRFESEVEQQLQRILANPQAFHFSKGQYREAALNKFPFSIVYKINSKERSIYISAIHHSSRDPRDKYRK